MTHAAPARWHGLDAVRGFALVAGVVLHASMAFLPGPQLWLVADATRSTTLSVAFFANAPAPTPYQARTRSRFEWINAVGIENVLNNF